MSAEDYDAWLSRSVESFAEDLHRATGRSLDATRARGAAQFRELLPDGLASEGMWLFRLFDESGDEVGFLWLGRHPERAGAGYVFDLEIAEPFRRRGLARAAMLAAEPILKEAGFTDVGLNVFGFNAAAQELYSSLGYRVVATQMTKSLD
jgi:ribosomal protein S18 acetylase RimI-like enzyme